MVKRKIWLLWTVLLLLLAGCGYKGDLYLPEADKKATIEADKDAEAKKNTDPAAP